MDVSRGDLVCLYLSGRADPGGDPDPRPASVADVAEALESGHSVAERVELLGALRRLHDEGLVEARVDEGGADGEPRRTYTLTDRGRERAARLGDRVADATVRVTNGVDLEVSLSEVDRFFEDSPVVRALARLTDDGEVPLDRYVGERFANRTDELAALESAYGEALDRGGRAVLVTGERGVGKSALVAQFRRRLAEHDAPPAVAVGACAAGSGPPFRVFERALGDLSAGPDLSALLAATRTGDGRPDAVRARRSALFERVADGLRAASDERPVVLVVEDLHGADEASLALLRHLVGAVTEWIYPVLFVATCRTEALGDEALSAFAHEVEVADRHRRLDLAPLDDLGTRVVLRRVLETERLPDPFVAAVHDRTGGNPLFVEETAKHLRETGAVDVDAGTVPTVPGAVTVPDRVAEAVDRRLSALDATGWDVAGLGAVVGTEIDERVLASASDVGRARLGEYVDLLVGSLVWERDGADLRFVHGVVRETILDRLDADARRDFHRRVAAALERVHADDLVAHAAGIADHYRAAGDDRRAVVYFVCAGDDALAVHAHDTALDHYRTALELARDLDGAPPVATGAEAADAGDRPEPADGLPPADSLDPADGPGPDEVPGVPAIAARLASVRVALADLDAAADWVRTGREAGPDDRDVRRLAVQAGRIANRRGDYERAREEAAAALTADPADETACELLAVKSRADTQLDDHDRAVDAAERMHEVAADLGSPEWTAAADRHLGTVERERGRFDRAREHFRSALSTYRDLDDRVSTASVENDLGIVAFRRGRYDRAEDLLEGALERAREFGRPYVAAQSRHNLGNVARSRGEYAAAREHYEAALSTFETAGNRHQAAQTRNNLGLIAQETGDLERAREEYAAALAEKRAIGDESGAARSRLNLGYVARDLDDPDDAREHFEAALALARRVGDRHTAGVVRGNLGALQRELGDHEDARDNLEAALEIFREVGASRWIGLSHRELGTLAHRQGDADRALDRLASALSTFEEIGATDEVVKTLETLVEVTTPENPEAARFYAERGLAALEDLDTAFESQRELFERTLDGDD